MLCREADDLYFIDTKEILTTSND
uniref:Uncharacterized protein n=1 Tax=Tetranychus urticae TaxID=32264 RepID=T1K3A8_TETUR